VYRALVVGHLPRASGEIHLPLPARGEGAVPAVTRYRVLEEFANSSLVEAEIETGRHHQVRRHFAAIRHPLMLDEVYGLERYNRVFRQEFRIHRFLLHAFSVDFPHPMTGEMLHIEAPMPRVFEDVLKKLRSLGRL
jgi:23S rRNA pseudouridine955/2504/2580 synthase